MGRNEDSLLRAAGEQALASATRGGSCTHPDQSRGLVQRHNMRAISGVGASSPILLFFIGGGVALHERLVGSSSNLVILEFRAISSQLEMASGAKIQRGWFCISSSVPKCEDDPKNYTRTLGGVEVFPAIEVVLRTISTSSSHF